MLKVFTIKIMMKLDFSSDLIVYFIIGGAGQLNTGGSNQLWGGGARALPNRY